MTIVIPRPTRRKAQRVQRIGAATVYRSKAAKKPDPVWRDVVAGVVFIAVLLLGVAVVLAGGLLVLG